MQKVTNSAKISLFEVINSFIRIAASPYLENIPWSVFFWWYSSLNFQFFFFWFNCSSISELWVQLYFVHIFFLSRNVMSICLKEIFPFLLFSLHEKNEARRERETSGKTKQIVCFVNPFFSLICDFTLLSSVSWDESISFLFRDIGHSFQRH